MVSHVSYNTKSFYEIFLHKNMNIFLDFDDTLFHTAHFREDMKKVFESCGVDDELFQSTYERVKKRCSPGKICTYDFDEHLLEIKKIRHVDLKNIRKQVDIFLEKAGKYFFDDTIDFCVAMRLMGARIYIVSYGTSSFQEKKVIASGIGNFVDVLCVGDIDKGKEIQKILSVSNKETSWFVEDRIEHIQSVKEKNPSVQTILLKRREGRYDDTMSVFCDFEARTMEEVGEIIRSKEVFREYIEK